MAQKVIYTCDLHTGEKSGAETLSLTWQGTDYELDVCPQHRKELMKAVSPYLEAARTSGSAKVRTRRNSAHAPARTNKDRQRSHEIRAWAKSQGIEVSERGRIPAMVVAQYQSGRTNGSSPAAEKPALAAVPSVPHEPAEAPARAPRATRTTKGATR